MYMTQRFITEENKPYITMQCRVCTNSKLDDNNFVVKYHW